MIFRQVGAPEAWPAATAGGSSSRRRENMVGVNMVIV